jgi:hypothetical protein
MSQWLQPTAHTQSQACVRGNNDEQHTRQLKTTVHGRGLSLFRARTADMPTYD